MQNPQSRLVLLAVAALLAVGGPAAIAAIDVRVDSDKAFDFKTVRTWGWDPEEAGVVRMARTQEDNPDAVKARAEPAILAAVAAEMMRHGLQLSPSQPDVTVTYYLLLTTNMSTQTMGQFVPATVAWGLPLFAPATQSMTVMDQGSLVLDLKAKGAVVWRGVAQAKIKMDADEKKREATLREAVRDLLRRYPPKQ